MKEKFYISTALPFINADPHIGFALELIQADVIARYQKNLDKDVFFITGTDENGLKIARVAQEAEQDVNDFAKQKSQKYRDLKDILNLSFDDFIRTTERRHVEGVKKLWKLVQKDIYKKKYKGLYCIGCERFLEVDELVDGKCVEHDKEPEIIEEENYFFALSKYEDKLRKLIETDKFKIVPETRKNEVLGLLKKGLQDICISRCSARSRDWGIKVPGDEEQTMWCWFDAVINYITVIGYGNDQEKFESWWQDNKEKYHFIGKGILMFHAVYWPAMLLSAGISLPTGLFVHGYITSGGRKMSKTLGNVVDPKVLVKQYGIDPVRYFLLREISPFEDGDFSYEKFEERYNSDLSKGLGNLISRVIKLSEGIDADLTNKELETKVKSIREAVSKSLEGYEFNKALQEIWELIKFCDIYIEQEKPWENKDSEAIKNVLYTINVISDLVNPFLPETSENIKEILETREIKALFPRI